MPVNAAAFFHMFFSAPETKGFTLEEMDDVFESGVPAWKRDRPAPSRLEELEMRLETESAVKMHPSPKICDGPETP